MRRPLLVVAALPFADGDFLLESLVNVGGYSLALSSFDDDRGDVSSHGHEDDNSETYTIFKFFFDNVASLHFFTKGCHGYRSYLENFYNNL